MARLPACKLVLALAAATVCTACATTGSAHRLPGSTLVGHPPSGAQDEEPAIHPDRPDVTNQTYTVPPALAQVEVGSTLGRVPVEGESLATPASVRIGITHWMEARIDTDGATRVKQADQVSTEFAGVAVGAKVRVWELPGERTLAVQPLVMLPFGRAAGSGTDFSLTALFDQQLGDRVETSANYGIAAVAGEGAHRVQHQVSVSTEIDLTQALKPYFELYWFSRLSEGDARIVSFDAGLTYTLTPRLAIDAGVLTGLARADPHPAVFAGLSCILGEVTGHRGIRARLREAQTRGDR
jgi:hypothetical protein